MSIKQTSEDVNALFREQKALVEKTNAIKKSIESEASAAKLAEKRQEAELRAADAQNESQRKHSMKSATQKTRTRTGAHAQGVADKTKELNALRRQNAIEEAELSKQVSAAKERLTQREQGKAERKTKLAFLHSQLDQCAQEMDRYDNYCEARTQEKTALKKQEEELQELIRHKEELASKLQQAKEPLGESKSELDDAQRLDAEATKIKEANDEVERSIAVPGREEMARLAEKKENLAMLIGQQHENSVAPQAQEKEELDSMSEARKTVSEELSVLKEELEGKKLKSQHFHRVQKESRENWEREISEHNNLEEKYQLVVEAEKAQIDEADQAREAEFDAQIEEAQSELESQRAEKDRQLHILLYGGEIIENARETERKLNEDPIDF